MPQATTLPKIRDVQVGCRSIEAGDHVALLSLCHLDTI
jgi:hypothetical protein